MSWREASREAGVPHYQSLQTHMHKHYTAAVIEAAADELDALIADAAVELRTQMQSAPAEVKPLYAAAIVNLKGLKSTKPSQAHLIQSLKTIQEMTGMRNEQRMLLTFMDQMFPKAVSTVPERPMLVENLADLEVD